MKYYILSLLLLCSCTPKLKYSIGDCIRISNLGTYDIIQIIDCTDKLCLCKSVIDRGGYTIEISSINNAYRVPCSWGAK